MLEPMMTPCVWSGGGPIAAGCQHLVLAASGVSAKQRSVADTITRIVAIALSCAVLQLVATPCHRLPQRRSKLDDAEVERFANFTSTCYLFSA